MSNARQEGEKTIYRDFSQQALLCVLTGVSVATVVYPLEVMQTRMQLGYSSLLLSNAKFFLAGLMNANKASMCKTSMMSQQDVVHSPIHDVIHGKDESPQACKHLYATLLTSGIIGGMDSATTNYSSNRRILNAINQNPVVEGIKNKFKFALIGLNTRFLKSSTNAFFCIGASTILNDPMQRLLPQHSYGIETYAATIASGLISGFLTNGLGLIYKTQIMLIEVPTLKAPSAYHVTNDLIAKNGVTVLTRGSLYSMLTTILAFGTMQAVDQLMSAYFFALNREESKHRLTEGHQFFTPTNNTPKAREAGEEKVEVSSLKP